VSEQSNQVSDEAKQAKTRRGPSRRRVVAGALGVIVVWLAVAGVAGPLSGKINQVQKNDNASFLPPKAESTKVDAEQKAFSGQNTFPFLVVWTRNDGANLGPADYLVMADQVKKMQADARISESVTSFVPAPGVPMTPGAPVLPAIPSMDGKAAELLVNFDSSKLSTPLPDGTLPIKVVADDIRSIVAQSPGMTAHVTGPGGLVADLFGVFGGIDTKLLLVTVLVVALILIIVYRSPFLWLIPLLGAGISLTAAEAVIYVLAKHNVVTLDGQGQGILTVLVFGAGTDYALLLIARYREELHLYERSIDAMRVALRGAGEAIIASAGTVIVGLLCLLFSELNNNKSLGPIAAISILCALLVMLTFLPALLVLFGRRLFWPFVPRFDSHPKLEKGFWGRVAGLVGRKPRVIWLTATVVLLVLMSGLFQLKASGISSQDQFTTTQDSVTGLKVLDAHFPAGTGSPVEILANQGAGDAVLAATKSSAGVVGAAYYAGTATAAGAAPKVVNGRIEILATLNYASDSKAAQQAIVTLRNNVHAVPDSAAIVGGNAAINLDVATAARHDRNLIIPIVLAVIFVILALLLRSLVAPLILIITVVLSYLATLGACAYAFNHLFKFAGADTSFPLFAFIFLVALGIDYNIFLMTRVREETKKLGTRPGTLKALAVTGGVITSAGVVLAATFSVLGVLPLVVLAEVGFAVAFGVLLDTLVVRSFLVPAFVYHIGSRIWLPSKLAKQPD
jgi:RND superfamily putative drug exporter